MYSSNDFRKLCRHSGLAVTHQRQVIFESLASMPDHPTPEDVYERVRKLIPAISLATVYKTLHTFVEHGLLREFSLHHGTWRVDINTHPHHHAVCTRCKRIHDIEMEEIPPGGINRNLPNGFQVDRIAIEIQGLCAECTKIRTAKYET